MNNPKELSITGSPEAINGFKKDVLKRNSSEWKVDCENIHGYAYLLFRYVGKELPKGVVSVYLDDDKQNGELKWFVCSVIPSGLDMVEYDKRDLILEKLYKDILKSYESAMLEIKLSG